MFSAPQLAFEQVMADEELLDPLIVTEPAEPPFTPSTSAVVYAGAPLVPVALFRTVPAPAFARAACSVPEVVTAALGVLLRTVPSPVKVTLVTVPEPPPPTCAHVPL